MAVGKLQAVQTQAGFFERMKRAEEITAAELHERYLQDVYRYVWQRVRAADEADDITAEVFAAATAGLSRFRGQCPPYSIRHRPPSSREPLRPPRGSRRAGR
jgi:hypothetical protein